MSTKTENQDRDPGDKKPRPPAERTGHVQPQDPALVTFLERLWTRGNPPERLEVWWVIGPNKDIRRALVHYENFDHTPENRPNIEDCTRISGEILSAAQDWTDGQKKPCSFQLAILDSYQKTAPLCRQIGPLNPEKTYVGVGPDGEPRSGDDDEEAELGLKPLTHKYLRQSIRSIDRRQQQLDVALGDTIQLQQAIIASQQGYIERQQNQSIAQHAQLQDSMDRSLDREVARDRSKQINKAIGAGVGVGTNLLYGWLGDPDSNPKALMDGGSGNGETAPARRHPVSAEQRLVESFLEECKEEKIAVELFGDWKNTKELTVSDIFAGYGLLRPGIFTPNQFGLFLAVGQGDMAPDALFALLPGQRHAITNEQLALAMPRLTQSMQVALMQLKDILDKKWEAANGAAPQGEATK